MVALNIHDWMMIFVRIWILIFYSFQFIEYLQQDTLLNSLHLMYFTLIKSSSFYAGLGVSKFNV